MTWGEFKTKMEEAGVNDDSDLSWLELHDLDMAHWDAGYVLEFDRVTRVEFGVSPAIAGHR